MAGAKGLFIGDKESVKAVQYPIDFEEYVNNLQSKAIGATAWNSTWFRAVVRKRANGVVSIPRRIMKGETEIQEDEFDGLPSKSGEPGIKPRIDFARLMRQGSVAIDRFGKAYFAVVVNNAKKPLEVRWLDPNTIDLVFDKGTGELLQFERRIKGVLVQTYPYDKATKKAPGIAWAWSMGMNEIGPGDTLVDDCKTPATALYMSDEMMNGLFARGAINQHWITATHNPPEAEKERIRERIARFMFGGVKNAHSVEVFAEGLVPTKIGTDPNSLELTTSTDRWQNDICAVSDTPRGLMNMADTSNTAALDRVTQTWIISTIKPHAQLIVDALNFHVLNDLGYTLELNTAGMDVDQQEEAEKAQAWGLYVDHDVDPETAAAMLGIDIPEGMPFIDEAKVAARQAAEQSRMDALQQARQNGQGPEMEQEKAADMKATKARQVEPVKPSEEYANEIAALTELALDGEITQAQMNSAWRVLATEAHTKALKRGLGVAPNEMLMSHEEAALSPILSKEYEAIDKAVTEVFSGLTANTGNGTSAV